MSQFSLPGVQKQYKGSDFRGTAGLHSGESGSIPSGVVVFSELDRQQQAFNTAVSLLEQQYIAADASDTQAWQAATSNLSRQLNNVAQGVASRMAVAARWEGSVSSLQSGLSVSSTGVVSIPQSSGAVTIASVNADFATNEDYYTQIKATSWESLVLVHNLTTASETGLYCVSGGTLRKFSPFFSQLQDGALIFVNSGEKANTFWTIADPIVVVGTDVVIPLLIPFGAFTALQTEPNGFLSIAANQLNASLDGAYFVVVNGQLTMTPAFVSRVTALEAGLQAAQANISTLQTGLQSEVTTRTAADAAMQTAIDGKASAASLQTEISDRSAADTALQTAIDTKASVTALQAEVTARSGADAVLQTAIDGNATAIQSEVTARTAADATLQTAIDGKASTVDLQAEVTARTAADTALQTAIATNSTAIQSEVTARTAADAVLQTAIDGNATAIQSEVTARTAADTALQTAIATNSTAIQSEVTARTAADATLQTAIDAKASTVDLQAEVTARTAAEGLLAIDIAARTTAAQLYAAIANFTAYSHPIKSLTNGVFSTVGVVPMTTFYVPLSDSLDWGVDRYSESASPFVNVQMPIVSYVNANATGVSGYFAKLEFQHETQVPDGEVEIYLTRHYRADKTALTDYFTSSATAQNSGASSSPTALTRVSSYAVSHTGETQYASLDWASLNDANWETGVATSLSSGDCSIVIDLGSEKLIRKIQIAGGHLGGSFGDSLAQYLNNGHLEYSSNGGNWAPVGVIDGVTNTVGEYKEYTPNVAARYWRIRRTNWCATSAFVFYT